MTVTSKDLCEVIPLTYPPEEDGVAHGLPRATYISEDFLKAENQYLFASHWTFVGFAHETPDTGDVLPATAAGQPIVLVRSQTGEVNAFHNVCRHRGHPVVVQPCRGTKSLVCPYHAWTYDLDGRLKRTPHFAGYSKSIESFAYERYGLRPIRCECWHDWVFVNLDGEAEPLERYLEPVSRRLEAVDFEHVTPIAKLDLGVVQANWKLLIENFIEPYHVPVVHSQSAGGQPLADHYMIVDGYCVGCAIDVSSESVSNGRDKLPQMLDMSTRYLMLFPNFVLAWYLPDQLGVHLNVPEAPDRTRQWRMIYHIGKDMPSGEYVQTLSNLWTQVHREDHSVVESLQRGRASPILEDGGLLSPHWETSVRQFHKLVVDALNQT